MKVLYAAIVLSILLTLLSPAIALAGPPEPSMAPFMKTYFAIQEEIVKLPPMDRRALLLLLEDAEARWVASSTAIEEAKGWEMLGRVAILTGEAIKNAGSSEGFFLITPYYFTCTMNMYPSLGGYTFKCPNHKRYWCKGLHCVNAWIPQ